MSVREIRAKTFRSQAAFRSWLEKNHDGVAELFVRCFKVEHSAKGLTYRQALDEALCFGWIDGVRYGLDEVSFANRFTPRRPGSVWSEVNTRRVKELQVAGLMHPAGLAAFEKWKGSSYSFESAPADLSPQFRKRLRTNTDAWQFFCAQAPWYQRTSAHWVMSAKREETREKRLAILVECSASGVAVPPLRRVGVRERGGRRTKG